MRAPLCLLSMPLPLVAKAKAGARGQEKARCRGSAPATCVNIKPRLKKLPQGLLISLLVSLFSAFGSHPCCYRLPGTVPSGPEESSPGVEIPPTRQARERVLPLKS